MSMLHREKNILLLVFGLAACGTDDARPLVRDDVGNDLGAVDFGADTIEPDSGMSDTDLLDQDSDAGDDGGDGVVCRPNHDGVITRDEVPVQAGLRATFKIATDATFETAGVVEDGKIVWDLSGTLENDVLEIVELKDPAGQWFETTFPTATYYSQLATDSDLLGVFEASDDALLLDGVVSPEDGLFKTEIEYDPAVEVLKFPIDSSASWTTEASVSGLVSGVVSFYSEDYTSVYAGEGTLKTPYGNFEVIRLRTDLTRLVGLLTTKVRTYTFVAECFGTVATIRSNDNETAVEFTTAAEIRRLAP